MVDYNREPSHITPRRMFNIVSAKPQPERPKKKGEDLTLPKIDHVQESMVSLEMAIKDNIVGITEELAGEHLGFYGDENTGMLVTTYKGKPVLYSGFRESSIIGGKPEFFIECSGAISA